MNFQDINQDNLEMGTEALPYLCWQTDAELSKEFTTYSHDAELPKKLTKHQSCLIF